MPNLAEVFEAKLREHHSDAARRALEPIVGDASPGTLLRELLARSDVRDGLRSITLRDFKILLRNIAPEAQGQETSVTHEEWLFRSILESLSGAPRTLEQLVEILGVQHDELEPRLRWMVDVEKVEEDLAVSPPRYRTAPEDVGGE